MQSLVADLHEQMVGDVAEGRRLDPAGVQALIERAPLSARQAVDAGLVDQLAYADEVEAWLSEHHGDQVRRIPFGAWARRDNLLAWIESWGQGPDQVAVLHLEGPIVMDQPGGGAVIRARRVVELVDGLREDDRVKAVVLHVNSPGGHALASDLMWRAVVRLGREKPVVASFEDVAASGGYYLAAPAQEIVARPGTLTGSIGVFGGKLVVGGGLRKLGVTTQAFLAGPNAAMLSASRPFTPDQRERFRASLQRFYDAFVQRVAAGRRTPEASIEPYCRGRVWTGAAARERGLVDRFGDLQVAVDRARALAGLREGAFRRRELSAQPRRSVLHRVMARVIEELLPGSALLERVVGLTPGLRVLAAHQGQPMAMLPFDLRVDPAD